MKKQILVLGVIVLIVIIGAFVINEKASSNSVVNNSTNTNLIDCINNLYKLEKQKGTSFNSQCLGTCYDYAVDIVHVPRTSEDDLPENQCADFRDGKVSKFIELDKNGEVVRVFGGGL